MSHRSDSLCVSMCVQQKAQQENTTLVSVLADIDIAINEVKEDTKNMKEDMKNMKKDMNNLKTEIRDIIRAEVATLVKTEVDKKLKKLEIVCKE
jgi:septal ring factor EnvC (AmiA/AmiB activator)